MADNEIRNPAKAYFKWKMPVITKSEDDWNFWNTEDKYNRTMFIGYNDTTTPPVASLFMIVDGKPMQAVGDDIIARIASLETNTAQALADIQALIDRVNAQQLEISNLQQECERILAQAADTVLDARTWAEGTDEDVADLGGEHSAKGWAQKANEIVASGLPSDASFEHITVTGSSKFGQDPDRENQPGLEIEGTGEIQAYRTVNMHNGATIEYDGTVDMPWSDSSNKVPNTKWVQQAVQHGTIDPNSELTCKRITTRYDGAFLMSVHTRTTGSKQRAYLSMPKITGDETPLYLDLAVSDDVNKADGRISMYPGSVSVLSDFVTIRGRNPRADYNAPVVFGDAREGVTETKKVMSYYAGHFVNGLITGHPDVRFGDGIPFRVVRPKVAIGSWEAVFGVTPTVPNITDAADSSSKVPNTKWVQGCITAKMLNFQPKLTAGEGIEISADNVISATGGGSGGGAVSSVNGKTGVVVLTGEDIKTSSHPESVSITTTFGSFAQMIETKQDKITATTALTAGSYDTDVGTYYTHIGENGLQVNNSSAVKQISLNMDDGLITPTKVSFTGADKTFTVAGTSVFNGKAAFTKPVTTTNTVSMLNGSAPLLSVGASGVRVNLTNATKFDCYTSTDGTDTSVCTITDGGISTNNAILSSMLTVSGAAFLSSIGNIFEAETTCAGELITTSNVTSTLWGTDGEKTVLSLDTTGQTFKVSSVGGTDMLNCNLATGAVNLPGMTLTPADGESSATIHTSVPIIAKAIASTDSAGLQGGFISTGYSAIQGVMGLFFQDDDWTTYATISPSNTSFANLVLTDEIPPGDNSNRAATTAWVKNAITTAVQNKADAATTVTTNTVQTITAHKNISVDGTKKYSRPIEIMMPTSTESEPTEDKTREIGFLSSEGDGEKFEGALSHTRFTNGIAYTRLRTGRLVNGTFKEGSVGVAINKDGTTFGTAPNTPANAAGNAIATVDWVRRVAGGPSKNASVTTAFSGSITSRTYTIYKNGNLWSIHVTATLNTHTLDNGTTEMWAFLSDISDDADVTKLLAGQVLFMNAYISGCTSAAQPGYYAIGVTAIRMEDGDLKAKLRSFDSAVTDIPAGLELSFDLTTWVSN